MNLGDFLIQESVAILWLIPGVIGLVMLMHWVCGQPVFTDRDWRFLFGRPREEVFSVHADGHQLSFGIVNRAAASHERTVSR
jgi:hypothetical protein